MSQALQSEFEAILHGAAVAQIDRAFLRITGSDATRWLNGMVTNSIQALMPGEGNYNFLLNAQGRIQGDCVIYREPGEAEPAFLLETGSSQLEAIQQLLDRFIIMDDVELASTVAIGEHSWDSVSGLALLGTQASELLPKFVTTPYEAPLDAAPKPGTLIEARANGSLILVLTPPSVSLQHYELWFVDKKERDLELDILRQSDLNSLSPETLESLHVYSGTPRFGVDIRERDLPQETNQTHALHFAKGCYLGQEIVERIRSRGQVHRLLTRFRLEGDLPDNFPVPLESEGKPAGELTSAARVPLPEGPKIYALGYARREFLELKKPFTYAGGTATPAPASDI